MIDKVKLDAKKPVGNGTGVPTYQNGTTIIPTKTADTNGPSGLNVSASGENLSAKWKGGAQSVPAAGKNQYM